MALFRQNQGLMARPVGSIAQPLSMQPQRPRKMYGLMGMEPEQQTQQQPVQQAQAQQAPAIQYSSQPATQAPAARGQMQYRAEMFGPVAGAQALADAANRNVEAMRQVMPQAPAATPVATGEITPAYRPPVVSPVANVQSPFTAENLAAREGEALSRIAEQTAIAQQRIQQQLGQAGIMRRQGVGGLEQALMARAAMQEQSDRARALNDIRTRALEQGAEFDLRKAQALGGYGLDAARLGMDYAMLPSRVKEAEAQAAVAAATVAPKIAAEFSQADQQKLQAESMDLANALKRFTPEQQQQIRNEFISEMQKRGYLDYVNVEAANRFLLETDPKQWWNWPGWKVGAAGLKAAKDISEIIKSFTPGAAGGK